MINMSEPIVKRGDILATLSHNNGGIGFCEQTQELDSELSCRSMSTEATTTPYEADSTAEIVPGANQFPIEYLLDMNDKLATPNMHDLQPLLDINMQPTTILTFL
jgi:hypothetical protein